MTCPASRPPIASATRSITCATGIPKRASASRSGRTTSCASPAICSISTPRVPSTLRTRASIALPVVARPSRSGPKSLMASCAFTPDSSSSTRVAIGCENENSNPGCTDSFSSINTCKALRLEALVQSDTGFRPTNISTFDTGSGSPPISARPTRLETYRTSGKVINRASSFSATRREVSRLADGASVTRIFSVPSSSSGTNSVPRKGSSANDPANSTTAPATTRRRRANAPRRITR